MLAVLFAFSAITVPASAEVLGPNDVSLNVSPQNPGPAEIVTLSLSSFSVDIARALVEWSVGGGGREGGLGDSKFSFKTKALGLPTTVTVVITPEGNLPITKTITITPLTVDILWEATDSTVPPFYRGRALPTSESAVKFVAIPQVPSGGTFAAPGNFFYTWQENYTPRQSASGYAKNSYATAMDYLNPTKHISVDVSGKNGATITHNEISLSPIKPELVWYGSNPLYGPVFDRALVGDITVKDNDASIIAEPYFFSPGSPTSKNLTYKWQLNGTAIAAPSSPNLVSLHRDTDAKGDATLAVSVSNTKKLFQELSGSLILHLQ